MASEVKMTAIVDVEDRTKAGLESAKKGIGGLQDSINSLQPTFKSMAVAGGIAFGAISAIAISSLKASSEAEAQMAKFDTTLKNIANTTITVDTGMKRTISTIKLTATETQAVNLAIREQENNLKKLNKAHADGKIKGTDYSIATEKIKNQIVQLNEKLGETDTKTEAITKTIKITADQVDKARVKFLETAKAVTKLGFDDEDASVSMAKLFQRTGDVTKALELNQLAMDLARAKSIDLETATTLVGQVLSGNGKVLKQYGIDIKDSATPLEALGELHDKVKGQALAFSETTAGAMARVKVETDNLRESVGDALAPAFVKLIQTVEPVLLRFTEWMAQNPETVSQILLIGGAVSGLVLVLGTLGIALPGIISGVGMLGTAMLFLANNPLVILVAGLVFFAQKFGELIALTGSFSNAISAMGDTIIAWWKGTGEWIVKQFERLANVMERIGLSSGASSGGVAGSVNVGSLLMSGAKKLLNINDGIVQNGQIISTHPEDTIFAMKDPSKMGGGGNININISGAVLTEEVARIMGDMLIEKLRFQLKF